MDDIDETKVNPDQPGDGQAERIAREIRRHNPQWAMWHDPVANKRFIDGLRDNLAGIDTTQQEDSRLRQESEEKPFSSDEFWGNPEEQKKYTTKKL
jgi:hypothetical protein